MQYEAIEMLKIIIPMQNKAIKVLKFKFYEPYLKPRKPCGEIVHFYKLVNIGNIYMFCHQNLMGNPNK